MQSRTAPVPNSDFFPLKSDIYIDVPKLRIQAAFDFEKQDLQIGKMFTPQAGEPSPNKKVTILPLGGSMRPAIRHTARNSIVT